MAFDCRGMGTQLPVECVMAMHASSQNIKYERVAMVRSDVVYLAPIDVFRSTPGRSFDKYNNHSVAPGVSLWPVNDRVLLGPYEATNHGRREDFQDFTSPTVVSPALGVVP